MDSLNFYFTDTLVGGHYRYSDTSEMDQGFLKKNLVQRIKNPNLIDSNYEEIAKHLEPFYEEGREEIKTDISGIIVPICHGDINDYFHVIISIGGSFEKNLRKIWKTNGICEEHPKDPIILRERGDLSYRFMKRIFNLPVFEAYKFLPGYRIPFPRGREEMPIQERISHVESAFNSWINENFGK